MFSVNMSPEDYCALWGCSPEYDREPRNRGDGCLFYNFRAEQNDPDFLERFIPAIERTILALNQSPELHDNPDLEDLQELLEYVLEKKAKT